MDTSRYIGSTGYPGKRRKLDLHAKEPRNTSLRRIGGTTFEEGDIIEYFLISSEKILFLNEICAPRVG